MACNASAPELRAAYDSYSEQGFEVLSVSIQEGDAEVAEFIDRHDLSYPILMDRTGETSATYKVASTPTTYFISPEGTIVDTIAGVVSEEWLEANIERYLTT